MRFGVANDYSWHRADQASRWLELILWPRASQRENKDQADGRTYYSALTRAATRIIPADAIKVSIYRTAEMMRVKLCEAAHIAANPLAFSRLRGAP